MKKNIQDKDCDKCCFFKRSTKTADPNSNSK